MMVSGINSSSASMYSNYRTTSATNSQSVSSETESQQGVSGAKGNRPPPPPGGGKGKGPEVDTNSDNVWDAEELTSLSEELTESGATSFSVDELLETYDTDGDGVISASEREAIKENNGFNLPEMKNMQEVMMNGSRGLQIQEASAEDLEVTSTTDKSMLNMISAYLQQSEYSSNFYNPELNETTE